MIKTSLREVVDLRLSWGRECERVSMEGRGVEWPKGSLPVGFERTHNCRDDPSQRSFTRSYACYHHRFTRCYHASLVHITTFHSVVDASSTSYHSLSLRPLTRIVFMWSYSLIIRDMIVVCIVVSWWWFVHLWSQSLVVRVVSLTHSLELSS
jgi:hypothetical protein